MTIFALDTKNQELYSLFKAGQEVQGDPRPEDASPRSPASPRSRARRANIKNAYDAAELAKLHPNLRFDSRWDKASGFKTVQMLARPRSCSRSTCSACSSSSTSAAAARSSPKDEEAAEELGKILGIAFYNQHRAARTNKPSKFGALVDKGLISEKDVEKAISAPRASTRSTSPRS